MLQILPQLLTLHHFISLFMDECHKGEQGTADDSIHIAPEMPQRDLHIETQ